MKRKAVRIVDFDLKGNAFRHERQETMLSSGAYILLAAARLCPTHCKVSFQIKPLKKGRAAFALSDAYICFGVVMALQGCIKLAESQKRAEQSRPRQLREHQVRRRWTHMSLVAV